ncbi:SagB/ThcOx family dehydrogenase [Pseudalkalibacillus hwajinpoensis]|uniref:SagB/ThcOx family dehydrogenase n=1 Tax=Guptibacillus hwajinpoensis TaxID=208199 RepID=UPI00146E2C30|nr:SagB/ThcOx family dehydrogenase [Pseudalkalibacillus hwajinpoensis]
MKNIDKITLAHSFHLNTRLSKERLINWESIEAKNENINNNYETDFYFLREYSLKTDDSIINENIIEAVENRKSLDKPTVRPLQDFELLSNLLFYSYGKRNKYQKRPVPSAGSKYPIDLYVYIFNVKDIEKGLYYYNTEKNTLQLVKVGDFRESLMNAFTQPELLQRSPFVVISVANFMRTCAKYGDRGYKLVYLDLGHISQNFYLLSSSMKLGCRAIFGFFDEKLNHMLSLGEDQDVVLSHVFGEEAQFMENILNLKRSDVLQEDNNE